MIGAYIPSTAHCKKMPLTAKNVWNKAEPFITVLNLSHLLVLLKVISIGFSSPRSIVYKDHRNAQGEFPAVLDSWLDEEDLTQGIFVTMLSKLIDRIPKHAFS